MSRVADDSAADGGVSVDEAGAQEGRAADAQSEAGLGRVADVGTGGDAMIDETLQDRQASHGDYHEQAEMACALRDTMRTGVRWASLSRVEQDALQMIAVKLSRILTGNPHVVDHWHDIQGYAALVERDLRSGDNG